MNKVLIFFNDMKINNYISRVFILLGLYIAFLLAASVLGGIIFFYTNDMTSLLILATVIAFGGSVVVYHKIFDKKWIDTSLFQKPDSWKWLVVAVILFAASVPLVDYFSKPETDQTILKLCSNASTLKVIVLVFGVAVFPAVFEEWFFRGIIQTNLSKVTKNSYVAIIITALVFSAMHFDFGNLVARFILGFILGLMFYYSKSLWVNILVHFANNFIVLLAILLQGKDGMMDMEEKIFDNILYIIPSILLIAAIILLYEKKKLINSES